MHNAQPTSTATSGNSELRISEKETTAEIVEFDELIFLLLFCYSVAVGNVD